MNKNLEIQIAKPFGPSIAKVKIPDELVLKLNDYVDGVIKDESKSKSQDFGGKLIGQVTQEFRLDKNFYKSSGWLEFLGKSVSSWILKSNGSSVKTFTILDTWVVRQFKNEYNPTHWHSGHVSGVGYLKVPKNLGSIPNKTKNPNGKLELIHGSRQFLSSSTFSITPEVGDFYLFPNYMMHTVYPFTDTDEERRSVSFNANVDEKIYNAI